MSSHAINAAVYADSEKPPNLFCRYITRPFGLNCIVHTIGGMRVLSVVQPLACDPKECGLTLFGNITAQECE